MSPTDQAPGLKAHAPIAFPARSRIPALGAVVRYYPLGRPETPAAMPGGGLRAIVELHARRVDGGPTHLLLRLLEGERAGMAVSTDHTRIEILPAGARAFGRITTKDQETS